MQWYREPGRVYIKDNNDIVIAKITYEQADDGSMCIDHTFVDPSLRGQGIASELVKEAVKEILAGGHEVTATCPYAARWLTENADQTVPVSLPAVTEKLYEKDAYLKEFDARVVRCEQAKKTWRIALDRSAFYPEGGGQPGDQGTLTVCGQEEKIIEVTDTHEKEDLVWHYTSEPLEPGTQVRGRINWQRRFDMMQNHSGEHIVSGLIHTQYGYDNVGFHMGSDFITIDLNGELTMEQLAGIEKQANEIVWQDAPVEIQVYTEEGAKAVEYRSKKELHGMVRIVTFPGADTCACCGTHVATTGQIGLIRLFSCQKFHEGVRIELLCGRRAMEYLDLIWQQNREVSMALSAKPLETAAAVNRMKESEAQARYRVVELEQQKIRSFAEEMRGSGNLLVFACGLTPDWVAKLTVDLMERRQGICAVFSGNDEAGYKYAVGMEHADLKALVREMNGALQGRGGGKPHFAQGSVACSRKEAEDFFMKRDEPFTIREYN